MQSSTVYHVLGSLVEKGIVSHVSIGKIKHYQAESPEMLLEFLEEKKKNLTEILPELKEKENFGKQKQSAKVFEGIKGLQSAFNDVLNTVKRGEEYYFFQFPLEKLQNEQAQLFFRNFHLKRAEKGIKAKGLARHDCRKIMQHMYKIKHTNIRFQDEPTPTVMVIYKNKVLMVDWDKSPSAFIIQSKTIAESYKAFFEEKWKLAKK